MLEPLDRHRKDSTRFQFTSKRSRDFIGPAIFCFRSTSKSTSQSL